MKIRLLHLGFCLIALSSSAIGQSLTFGAQGPITLTGNSEEELIAEFSVTNSGLETINFHVKRTITTALPGSSNWFCWGTSCYLPNTNQSINSVSIIDGFTDTTFSAHLNPAGNVGNAEIMYTFFNAANPNDSSSIVVRFEVSSLSTGPATSTTSLSTYPNPASDFIRFDFNNIPSTTTIEILNLLGERMENVALPTIQGQVTLPVGEFSPGIYFYNLKSVQGRVIKSGRFIVRH